MLNNDILVEKKNVVGKSTPQRQPRYAEVIEHIEQLIQSGKLISGDQLPSERHLAEQLHVSRNAVRQALTVLAHQDVLEISPRGGAYVRHHQEQAIATRITRLLQQEDTSLTELFEVCQMLEIQSARLTAQRWNEADREQLEHLNQFFQEGKGSYQELVEAEVLFHITLVAGAHNTLLIALMRTLFAKLLELDALLPVSHDGEPSCVAVLFNEHQQMLTALIEGNGERAAMLVAQHRDVIRDRITLGNE